jgi:hypothetical protein
LQIPNIKHQISNKFQKNNFQTLLVINILNLIIIWDLVFGIWDFSLSACGVAAAGGPSRRVLFALSLRVVLRRP